MSRLYHLSYDTINCDRDFGGNYPEARRFMLCVIASSPIITINSFTESSLILEYEQAQPVRLFRFLRNNLDPYFYYSVSLVAKNTDTGHQYISHNPNMALDINLQRELSRLACNNLGKPIVDY